MVNVDRDGEDSKEDINTYNRLRGILEIEESGKGRDGGSPVQEGRTKHV